LKLISTIYGLPIIFFFSFIWQKIEIRAYQLSGFAQGTSWNITYFNSDSIISKNSIDSIFNSIDSSLSIYKPYSLITQFNKSKRGIRTNRHLYNVVRSSLDISKKTSGLSDITVGPLVAAWGFGVESQINIPGDEKIKELLTCVGYKKIKLTNDSLIKTNPCVQIDVNGIAQGYTVDVIAKYLNTKGVDDFLVELGGELRAKGRKQPDNKPFRIGIESPSGDDFSTQPMQRVVNVNTGAITTSGNYRKFHESKGKKYSHIIDPRTGKSVENEMISVTVFARDATTADAYDNALMLMGLEQALEYIERRPDMAAFIIYKNKDGSIADTASTCFRRLIQN